MTQTQVQIQLKSANRKPAGNGFMVICDAIVDGQENDVIFWDPTSTEAQLRPGTELLVDIDGQNAKWNTHNGKTSFQIRPAARVEFTQQGTGPAPAANPPQKAYGASNQQEQRTHSANELLQRHAELVKEYAIALEELGFSDDFIKNAAPLAPSNISSWWFGTGGKWA